MKFYYTIYNFVRRCLFPNMCVCCEMFQNDEIVCVSCNEKLKKCVRKGAITFFCKTKIYNGYALFKYVHQEVKNIVIYMKRHDNVFLFDFCSLKLADNIKTVLPDYKNYTVVHIPTRKQSIAQRGFDQAKILSVKTSSLLEIPYQPILIRQGKSKEQKRISPVKRRENVRGVFKVDKSIKMPKNIILIDDVCTTGATALECIKTLNNAGCKNIVCFFVATSH